MTHNIYNKGDWVRFYANRELVFDEVHSIGKTEIGNPFVRTLTHGIQFFDDIVECRAAPSYQEPNKKPVRIMPLSVVNFVRIAEGKLKGAYIESEWSNMTLTIYTDSPLESGLESELERQFPLPYSLRFAHLKKPAS
jgi:hypothetical protein